MNGDSSIRYKGYSSPTLHLVLLSFVTGTILLLLNKIGEATWNTGVLGSLSVYIAATTISKGTEAYMAVRTPQAPPQP